MQPAKTSNVRDKIKMHMKQLNNHDPDIVQVGIRDICHIILNNQIDLKSVDNKDIAKQITNEYLKQVGSQNFAVHSVAIRSLAQIVPKVSKEELIHILKSTMSSIVDPKTDIKRMQVYCSSASTMINFAPGDLGINLSTLFVECVNQFLRLSSNKNNKQEQQLLIHLLNLIIDFSQKWPDVVGNRQLHFDRQLFNQVLLKNIEHSTKLDLIKKSDAALQKLAAVFNKQNFQFVFNHKQFGILNYIRHNKNAKSQEQLKKLKNGIACLDHLAHAHNRQMRYWVKQIAKICVELVIQYKNMQQHLYETTQIIQSSIDCLTALLKAYSSELTEWIGTPNFQYLSSFIEETLNFDRQNLMTYLEVNNDMEDQFQEDMDYYDESSVCWKVRQVSLSYIQMLMRKDNEFKEKRGKNPNFLDILSTKLIQQNQGVSKRAFQCFNYIIQSISTTKNKQQQLDDEPLQIKRVKSDQGNFAFDLVNKISSKIQVLFNHKKTKDETKTQAAKTLLNLIQLLNQLIKDNQTTCQKVLNLIHDLIPKVKPDSCVFLIKSSKSLINGTLPYAKVQKIIGMYIKMTKNNNFKIVAASFQGIRNVIKCYPDDLIKSGKINEILSTVLGKLKQHDADKLVKVQSTRCLGPIFKSILSRLPQNLQTDLLSIAQAKIKLQIDKTTIFSQIPHIPNNYPVKKSQQQILKNMLDICSQSIGTANHQLSNLSIQCCDKLIRLQQKSLNEKTVQHILDKSRPLLIDDRIPKFMDILIDLYPNSFKPYAQAIVKTAEGKYIKKLINKKIIPVDSCITILKNVATLQNSRKLSIIVAEINPSQQKLFADTNQTKWGLVSLGALGYVGDLKTIDQIMKNVLNHPNHDLKFQGARSIGNIASRHPEYALKLIELAKKSSDNYLYLQALKQMLSFRTSEFPKLQQVIYFILQKSQENDRETNKHLLAESIGYIARFSPKQLSNILSSVKDMSPARRSIIASSLRYALEDKKKQQVLDESLQEFIEKVVFMVQDKDIGVKEGALKSLNSIVQSRFDKIRQQIDKQFLDNLLDAMTIKPQLIKIIDYGVSKQKKDMGKGLRIEAFNFLKAIINMRQLQSFFQRIIGKCLQKINEQTSNDLILKRVNIIRVVSQKDVTSFMPYANQFATKLGTTQGILKPYTGANTVEDERSQGYLKGLFKQILLISKSIKQGSQVIRGMINKITTIEKLNKILQSVQKSQ